MTKWTAKADPTKEFFIDMITRDIGLDECIFDLLDNSIDGAYRNRRENGRLDSFSAEINIYADSFTIHDNCGGMKLSDATDYAFHFGRRADAPKDSDRSIGLYGIGMKRAVFKIGKKIVIQSSTESHPEEAFLTTIEVDNWAASKEWDFTLEQLAQPDFIGTRIDITDLKEGVGSEFGDELFIKELRTNIGRYYSFFIEDGFEIKVNGVIVKQHIFGVRSSEEIEPYVDSYVDKETGVNVRIVSGLAGIPPDDASDPDVVSRNTSNWGWFVVCNNRVVLAGDKTDKTVWGDGTFPSWHPQYNGFMGIVFFDSENPGELPWTTTKRQIDETVPVYRRAVVGMRDATRTYLNYTNTRKSSLEQAKSVEGKADYVSVKTAAPSAAKSMKLPIYAPKPKVRMANILYTKPLDQVEKVAVALGNRSLSYKDVGIKTFEYFYENEVGE